MSPAPTARLRGIAVGALSAALAIAAHGYGGGALPSASGVALLLILAGVIGSVVAETAWLNSGRLPLLAALLSGQLLGHLILSAPAIGHDHASTLTWSMVLAHLAAALGCAALIGVVERLYGPLASLIRAATATAPTPPAEPKSLVSQPEARRVRRGAAELHPISRRGPPALV